MKESKHPVFAVLEKTFSKSVSQDLELHYFPRIREYTKWVCLSDYCLDDKNKPNNIITYSLMPYITDIDDLSSFIKLIAPKDIKNTQRINRDYMHFLKHYPLINFSFVINNRKRLFETANDPLKESLIIIFSQIKEHYLIWLKNQPEKDTYYQRVIKKIDQTLIQLKDGNKIKQIYTMFLVAYLGGFASSIIVKKIKPELFGWLSDRDAINEVSDHLSIDLFDYYLFNFSQFEKCRFASAPATSKDIPFYDELLKIPDYIAGTLADYNASTGNISKPKFDTVLTEYMAENVHNNFVFRLEHRDGMIECARITTHKKHSEF